MRFDYLKKVTVLLVSALCVSIVCAPTLQAAVVAAAASSGMTSAQGNSIIALLQQIANNTNGVLQQVNGLQTILGNLYQVTDAWISSDTSTQTAQIQGVFAQLGTQLNKDLSTQLSSVSGLDQKILTSAATKDTLSNANDLVYGTLIGSPFWPLDQDPRKKKDKNINPPLNYILNASAASINHVIPGSSWQGKEASRLRYKNYYNIARSVETFGAYALVNQLADGNQLNTLQTQLINQATTSTWFSQVSTEKIGWVLRQILMYQSQTYVLFTQMLQYQKQMVTAQVMTNATLIAANQQNEGMWVAYAQGVQPTL